MRAEKRVTNSKKELATLKKIIANAPAAELQSLSNVKTVRAIRLGKVRVNKEGEVSGDVESTIAKPEEIETKANTGRTVAVTDVDMEDNLEHIDSLKNQHGAYPFWMSMMKVKKLKRAAQKKKVLANFLFTGKRGKKRKH